MWIYFRKEPPTEEELLKNLAIIKLKQKNAALIDEKYPNVKDHAALKRDETGQKSAFPTYEEYEIMPGKPKNSKDWRLSLVSSSRLMSKKIDMLLE